MSSPPLAVVPTVVMSVEPTRLAPPGSTAPAPVPPVPTTLTNAAAAGQAPDVLIWKEVWSVPVTGRMYAVPRVAANAALGMAITATPAVTSAATLPTPIRVRVFNDFTAISLSGVRESDFGCGPWIRLDHEVVAVLPQVGSTANP